MRTRSARLAAAYLWLQAATVAVWWVVLWQWPAARRPFVVGDWPEATLVAFALPDGLAIVGGSALAALGLRRDRLWSRPVLCAVAGAVGYATLWCAGALLVTGSGWLDLALMLASSAGTALALWWSRA